MSPSSELIKHIQKIYIIKYIYIYKSKQFANVLDADKSILESC